MGCCCTAPPVASDSLLPIAVLGLPGVGKTSFIEFLAGDLSLRDPPVTTGGLIQRQVDVQGHAYLFYDVCAYAGFADVWVDVMQKSRAIILFFDRASLDDSFVHVASMYQKLSGLIVQRQLPTLVLVNRAEDPINLGPLEDLNAEHLAGTTYRMAAFVSFDQELFHFFEWLVGQVR
jgi:GTPase SAR1 family protein